MFGVPPNTLPMVNVHVHTVYFANLGIIALEHMSFKTIFGGFNGAF